MRKPVVYLLASLPLVALLFWLVANSRAATPTPDYTVVLSEGSFEVRDYPELKLATTSMPRGKNNGFMKLFRFITGANEQKQKIAMTAPVLIEKGPEKETMSFIMPKDQAAVPAPTSSTVEIGSLPASRYAVMRFPGRQSGENEQAALEKLTAWTAAQKLRTRGEPIFAYYDPPWTPTRLRRNEVMVRVAR